MSGRVGILAGALGLAALETLLTSTSATDKTSADRVSGLFSFPAAAARWLIDPTVPGLPDLSNGATRPVPTWSNAQLTGQAPTSPETFTTNPLDPLGLLTAPSSFRLTTGGSATPGSVSVSITPNSRPAPVPVPRMA